MSALTSLEKVWCGGLCFHKLKIVQTLFTKGMAFKIDWIFENDLKALIHPE